WTKHHCPGRMVAAGTRRLARTMPQAPAAVRRVGARTKNMSNILLSAQNVTRRFQGLTAIDGVSLTLARGALHAVIGTNGAGKSTLINVLSGEIPPNEGKIVIDGQEATSWSQPQRAQAGLGRS